jgi:HSP20 family molecular chaperone IbpA
MEIDYGPFERRIAVDVPIDSDAAEAIYDNGLLSIRLPIARRVAGPVRVNVTRDKA